jgi:PKD repeat protein
MLSINIFSLSIIFHPASSSATIYYVDPYGGNDKNNGLSPTSAWRNPRQVNHSDNILFLYSKNNDTQHQIQRNITNTTPLKTESTIPTTNRVILGSKEIRGWIAASQNNWKTQLTLTKKGNLYLKKDGKYLTNGCNFSFLNLEEYYYDAHSKQIYISTNTANLDKAKSEIIAEVWSQSTILEAISLTGWIQQGPTGFSVDLLTKPLYLLFDGTFQSEESVWWWGPHACADGYTGEENTLNIIAPDGDPDQTGKHVEVVAWTGGWSVASGDFNGDGFRDVINSNQGAEVYVNYGKENFESLPDQILRDPGGEAVLGFSVASAGDVNKDGYEDLLVTMDYGVNKAYLYLGSASGLSNTPDVVLTPPPSFPESSYFGDISNHPGDFNGDGYRDVVISSSPDAPYIFVYYGSKSGLHSSPDLMFSYPGTTFRTPSYIGDLNGDGFDDLAIAATDSTSGSSINTKLYIYKGSSQGIVVEKPQKLEFSVTEWERFLFSDFNADGHLDLILGNEYADGYFVDEGAAYIFYGSSSGFNRTPDAVISNPRPNENVRFGASIEAIGDFNYDGYPDFAAGCPYGSPDGVSLSAEKGFVAVYFGSSTGLSNQPSLMLNEQKYSGWSLAHAGDIKGNGQNFMVAGEEFGASYLYALEKPLLPVANFSGIPTSGVAPLEVRFTDKSTESITDRLWVFGDGQTSTDPNPTHTYATAGTYTVSLTVKGPGGGNTRSFSGYIQVLSQTGSLTVTISPEAAIQAGAQWRLKDGEWQESGRSISGIPMGQYTIQFQDIPGWMAPEGQMVTIANGQTLQTNGAYTPSIGANFAATPTSGTVPLRVTFKDGSKGIVDSWLWDFGDGRTCKKRNPVYTYRKPGSYTVKLTVSGSAGSSTVTQIACIKAYAVLKPNFTATPRRGEAPLPVRFADKSTGSVTSWLWDFGDQQTSTEQNPIHTYAQPGNYVTKLTVAGPAGSGIKTQVVSVKAARLKQRFPFE